jgi:hypothetical protein
MGGRNDKSNPQAAGVIRKSRKLTSESVVGSWRGRRLGGARMAVAAGVGAEGGVCACWEGWASGGDRMAARHRLRIGSVATVSRVRRHPRCTSSLCAATSQAIKLICKGPAQRYHRMVTKRTHLQFKSVNDPNLVKEERAKLIVIWGSCPIHTLI